MNDKIKKFGAWLSNFGVYFAIKASINTFKRDDYEYDILNYNLIYNYLHKHLFKRLLKKYENKVVKVNRTLEKFPVWICWFQGEETMPEICKMCLNSVRKNIIEGNEDIVELHIITFDNMKEYIDIPDYVWDKINKKHFTYTLFSDLVRMTILAKYGGLYLDSTLLVTKPLPRDFFNYDFFSIKSPRNVNMFYFGQIINKGYWKEYIYKGSNEDILFHFVRDALLKYMKKYNYLIEYFLVDFCVLEAKKHFNQVSKNIENLEINNTMVEEMRYYLNDAYDEKIMNHLLYETYFHKLSYKFRYDDMVNDKLTLYGKLKELYLKN